MGTLAITSSGFAPLPAGAPAGWPPELTYPAGGSFNGTKNYTFTDADAQQMLAWIAGTYKAQLMGANPPPVSVSAIAVFVAWLNGFMTASTNSTQQYHTTPPVVPPPIVIS